MWTSTEESAREYAKNFTRDYNARLLIVKKNPYLFHVINENERADKKLIYRWCEFVALYDNGKELPFYFEIQRGVNPPESRDYGKPFYWVQTYLRGYPLKRTFTYSTRKAAARAISDMQAEVNRL